MAPKKGGGGARAREAEALRSATRAAAAAESSAAAKEEAARAAEPLFAQLAGAAAAGGGYKRALKLADEIAALLPGDPDAAAARCVALTHLGRFEEALAASDGHEAALAFERAYCLYRLGRHDAALTELAGCEGGFGPTLLEAQVLYNLGRHAECVAKYQEVAGDSKAQNLEVRTNVVAAHVAAGRWAEVPGLLKSMGLSPKASFEVAFNSACARLAGGELEAAEQELHLAMRLGKEALFEEDFTEKEVKEELLPITVQLAHVAQLLGRADEAAEAYQAVLKEHAQAPDVASIAVASNNLAASLVDGGNTIGAMKRLDKLVDLKAPASKLALSGKLASKMNAAQRHAIFYNRAGALLQAKQLDACRELATELAARNPDDDVPVLLQAAVLYREKRFNRAEEVLSSFEARRPGSAQVQLMRAQCALAHGDAARAATLLQSADAVRSSPAAVATVVALHEGLGDAGAAEAALDAAVAEHSARMVTDDDPEGAEARFAVMQAGAALKAKAGRSAQAVQAYRQLLELAPTAAARAAASVGLVRVLAKEDPAAAEEHLDNVPMPRSMAQLDVDMLEAEPDLHVEDAAAEDALASERRKRDAAQGADGQEQKRARTRKRKPRYPKGFDPANPGPPPDPERWLPKTERSTYRGKRKKKDAGIRGAQGATPSATPTGEATSAAPSAPVSRPSSGRPGKKKKR